MVLCLLNIKQECPPPTLHPSPAVGLGHFKVVQITDLKDRSRSLVCWSRPYWSQRDVNVLNWSLKRIWNSWKLLIWMNTLKFSLELPLKINWCSYNGEQPCLGDVPLTTDGQACCRKAFVIEQSHSVLKGDHGSKHVLQMLFVLVPCGTAYLPHGEACWDFPMTQISEWFCDAPAGC